MDWKTYESVTKYIYETLGQQNGVKIEGYGNDCRVIGHSGVYNTPHFRDQKASVLS